MKNTSRITDKDEILEQLQLSIEPFSEAEAEYDYQENRKKVILAQNKPEKGTVASKEDAAYLSEAYAQYMKDQRAAAKERAYWKARRDYLHTEFENSRSDRADNRALMKGI